MSENKLKKSQLIEKLVLENDNFLDENDNRDKMEVTREAVNLFFDSIKEAVIDGDRVEIRGFGSFSTKNYEAYVGRNPKTGAQVEVSPKKLPVFRPGRELKEMVNAKSS